MGSFFHPGAARGELVDRADWSNRLVELVGRLVGRLLWVVRLAAGEADGGGIDQQGGEADEQAHGGQGEPFGGQPGFGLLGGVVGVPHAAGFGHQGVEDGGAVCGGGDDVGEVD